MQVAEPLYLADLRLFFAKPNNTTNHEFAMAERLLDQATLRISRLAFCALDGSLLSGLPKPKTLIMTGSWGWQLAPVECYSFGHAL